MHFVRFQRAKFKFNFVLILMQGWISVNNGLLEDISCSIKTLDDKELKMKCETYDENSGCSVEDFQIKEDFGNPLTLKSRCNDDSYCNIEINIPISGRGETSLFINEYNLQGEQICIQIILSDVTPWNSYKGMLNVGNIKLPHGTFSLIDYTTNAQGHRYILARKTFTIWNDRQNESQKCRLVKCSHYRYENLSNAGLLRFYFKFEDEGSCEKESDNKATLLKLESEPMTEENCINYNNTDEHDIISSAIRYRKPVDISTQPVSFHNVETGCYLVRARPGCFFGLFWFKSTNVIDLNKWNTSILLIPRENQGSLHVKWEWPPFPYNFTSWGLKLWKMDDYPVKCNGRNPMNKKLTTMTPSAILNTSYYTFINLTVGYYCIRLGGIDDRCPEDGCELRSSATVLFDPSRSERMEKEQMNHGIPIILLAIAGVIVGVCFSLICFRYNWTSKKTSLQYELVAGNAKQLGTTSVLLIWTKYSSRNVPSPEPLIRVLKSLLKNYYLCQVFDYLDPLSLPNDQCRQLMSDPTSWLNSQLRKSDVKIIIVASEGAYWRQQELSSEKCTSLASQLKNPLDKNLFPYVLNFLQESFKLAADYSRVFQV